MKKIALIIFGILIFANVASAQNTKFNGEWEYYWNREASKGFVVTLKQKNGKVTGVGSGFIPHLYDAEIKSSKITGNSFIAKVADDWGNTATVKITISGKKLLWRVLSSKRRGSFTFPDKLDLKRSK
jgi:hypothetical protein